MPSRCRIDRRAVISCLKDYGIVGAGGAGFPTYAKWNFDLDLLINAAECEPFLQSDKWLLKKHSEELKAVMSWLKKLFRSVTIAIKSKYIHLVKNLNTKVATLPDRYPVGDEQCLTFLATGKRIPAGGLPIDVGVVVTNLTTAYLAYQACCNNKPFVERYVTIIAPKKLLISKLPIGTPIELIASQLNLPTDLVIDGGPAMGEKSSGFTKKTTSALIFAPKDSFIYKMKTQSIESILQLARVACATCNNCTLACPRWQLGHPIDPASIMRKYSFNAPLEELKIASYCCHCNVCTLVCPLGLSPSRVNFELKKELRKVGRPDKLEAVERDWTGVASSFAASRLLADFELPNVPEYTEISIPSGIKLRIYLNSHIGKIPNVLVQKGQSVEKYDPIAKIDTPNNLGVNYHSPVKGIIENVGEEFVEIKVS